MRRHFKALLSLIAVLPLVVTRHPRDNVIDTCSNAGIRHKNASVFVTVSENANGEQLTKFSTYMKLYNYTRGVDLGLEKSVIECGESKYLLISGLVKDAAPGNVTNVMEIEEQDPMLTVLSEIKALGDKVTRLEAITSKKLEMLKRLVHCPGSHNRTLKFDSEFKGNKIHLSNDFLNASRESPRYVPGYGGLITSRPLNDDELFQVRVDQTIDSWNYGLSIGVILKPTFDLASTLYIYGNKGTWSLLGTSVYKDDSLVTNDYPMDLRNLEVGTIIGVVRKSNGDLHFSKNGIEYGVAVKDTPSCIYGYVDVRSFVTHISIVNDT